MSSNRILNTIGEYLILALGTFLYCLPWEWFVVPNGYSSGGVTGLCILLQYATGGTIPVSISYLVANVFLLIVGFAVLGKSFGFKTIFVIALSSAYFAILPKFPMCFCAEGGFLFVPDKVLIPIIAGVIEGLGLGIVLRYGGSTGGSDIFAMILNKYWPISPGKFYVVSDAIVIAMVLFFPGKGFSDVVYGYLMMIASAVLVDYVIIGSKSSVQVLVFSSKNKEISEFVLNKMDRGVTILKAVGGYTGDQKDVILLIVRNKELSLVTSQIKEIDHSAFVSVVPAKSVYGEGFEEIKTGFKRLGKKTASKIE